MTQIIEAVAVPPPPDTHDKDCPFCKKEDPNPSPKSKIGKDNKSKELEDNLGAEGEPREDVGFEHEDYGAYSGEPHHLIPGNEALKGHPK